MVFIRIVEMEESKKSNKPNYNSLITGFHGIERGDKMLMGALYTFKKIKIRFL